MTSPHLSRALGEAHRAELRRQAELYRGSRPAAIRKAGSHISTRVRVALIRLSHAVRRPASTEIAVATAMGPSGEQNARVETADSAC
jgi:hypothetical protein